MTPREQLIDLQSRLRTEGIVASDTREHRSASRYDRTDYVWIAGSLRDVTEVPDEESA